MSLIKNKKGQVTIFMIVALVIVIGGSMFFYFTRVSTLPENTETEALNDNIPLQFDPVQSFITDCLSSTSVEGLKIIGEQGGYASFTNKNINKENFILKNEPTESDAVSFTKDSNLKIPYWYYLKSQNGCSGNCEFSSKRPGLRDSENSIEKQLERHIDFNLKNCINNFESFSEQGFEIKEESGVKSDVTITEEDVVVSANYKVSAKSQDSKQSLDSFTVHVPVNIARMYELATKITNMQSQYNFLEKHALNLIVAFSGVDNKKLPPMSDMRFKFGAKESWQKTEIKNRMTGLLTAYVPAFQVDGTYNYDRNLFGSEMKQSLYDSTIIPIDKPYSEISAEFTYLDFWPAYFNLNCKGELCKPSSANGILSFIGIQDYTFSYDLSFPVLVELKDVDALNGEGYSFNFFLEANVRNNKEMKSAFRQLEAISISESSQLCEVTSNTDTKINVVDAVTKQKLDNAQVLYSVIGESCFIGTTENGAASGKIPIALGGAINAIKDGYIGKAAEYDAKLDAGDELTIELSPIKSKKVIVKKKSVVKSLAGWQFADQEQDLSEKDSAAITLTRINSPNELEFSSVAEYKTGQDTEIEIAPGEYQLEITLMSNERIVIPARRECVTALLGLVKECYDLPKIDLAEGIPDEQAQFIAGGINLDITVTPADLEKGAITFYAVNIGLADVPQEQRVIEDLDQIGKIEQHSEANKIALWPRFE